MTELFCAFAPTTFHLRVGLHNPQGRHVRLRGHFSTTHFLQKLWWSWTSWTQRSRACALRPTSQQSQETRDLNYDRWINSSKRPRNTLNGCKRTDGQWMRSIHQTRNNQHFGKPDPRSCSPLIILWTDKFSSFPRIKLMRIQLSARGMSPVMLPCVKIDLSVQTLAKESWVYDQTAAVLTERLIKTPFNRLVAEGREEGL